MRGFGRLTNWWTELQIRTLPQTHIAGNTICWHGTIAADLTFIPFSSTDGTGQKLIHCRSARLIAASQDRVKLGEHTQQAKELASNASVTRRQAPAQPTTQLPE